MKKINEIWSSAEFLDQKENVTEDIGKTDLFPVQVIAINGVSLVGLPLSTCQQYIKVSSHTRHTNRVEPQSNKLKFSVCLW